jgi:hypothetical protein
MLTVLNMQPATTPLAATSVSVTLASLATGTIAMLYHRATITPVVRMPTVRRQMGATPVTANMDTQEMEQPALLCVLTVDPMPTVPAAMRRMNTCVGVTMDTLETPQTTVMILTSVRLESTVRLSMPTATTQMEVSPASVPAVTTIRESLTNV